MEVNDLNGGGTHEQNSNGGIPQGMSSDGSQNLAEAGETTITVGNSTFVFSNRINTTKPDKYNLPKGLEGLSYADASKKIEDMFKDREDNASMKTKEEFLTRLATSQEDAKLEVAAAEAGMPVEEYVAAMEAQAVQAKQQADLAEQTQAQGQPITEVGQTAESPQPMDPAAAAPQPPAEFSLGGLLESVGGVKGLGNIASGSLGNMSDLATSAEKVNVGGSAAKGALSGAMSGMSVGGPVGAAAGAIIGGVGNLVGGIIGNKKLQREELNKEKNSLLMDNAEDKLVQNRFKYGGTMKKYYAAGGETDPPTEYKPFSVESMVNNILGTDSKKETKQVVNSPLSPLSNTSKESNSNYEELPGVTIRADKYEKLPGVTIRPDRKEVSKMSYSPLGVDTDFTDKSSVMSPEKLSSIVPEGVTIDPIENVGNNNKKSDLLGKLALGSTLSPILGNIIEGSKMKGAAPNKYSRRGRGYIPNYADEATLVNQVNQAYAGADKAIAAGSNNNLGAYRANMLGLSANKADSVFGAYNQINDINRQEDSKVNADLVAMEQEDVALRNREILEDRQDASALAEAKMANRAAAYKSIADLGKEIYKANTISEGTTYNIAGNKKKNI